MEKIQQSVLQTLRENALANEVIIVGADYDVGVDEYVTEKAEAIRKAKNIYSSLQENVLMLEYPMPKTNSQDCFQRFFDSAAITAKNNVFAGCFAIDITAYADCLDDPGLEKLMYYIKENPKAVYCLVVYTKNTEVADKVFTYVSQSAVFMRNDFAVPDAQRLADYTASLIREFVPHIEADTLETLRELYGKNEYGYDFAEQLAQILKNKKYNGDKDELVKAIEQAQKINGFVLGGVYGY